MSKSDRIRQLLTKGVEVKEIVKRLKVPPNLVHQVKWQAKKKKAMPERSTDPKVQKVEKKYIKKATRLYKSAILTKKEIDALIRPLPDPVNHPRHYKAGGVETIDFIEAKDLNYRLGNVIKYVSRAGKKDSDPLVDLKKARWYLDREISAREAA